MKVLFILFIPLLFGFTKNQLQEIFSDCMESGKSVRACKAVKRKAVREERQYKLDQGKKKEEKVRNEQLLDALDDEKYRIVDQRTGKVINTRGYNPLRREKIQCESNYGVWTKGGCKGSVGYVTENKKATKKNGYYQHTINEVKKDKSMWNEIDAKLERKEKKRKYKKWKKNYYKKKEAMVARQEFLQANPDIIKIMKDLKRDPMTGKFPLYVEERFQYGLRYNQQMLQQQQMYQQGYAQDSEQGYAQDAEQGYAQDAEQGYVQDPQQAYPQN
jgi:hypothetical protein